MNTARRGRKRKPPERNKLIASKSVKKEASFICKDCGCDCKVEDALKWHMLTKHEKDMRQLESYEQSGRTDYRCICDVCTESFRNKMEIRKHIKSHHLNNHDEPEYECDTCGKQFSSDGRMNRHIIKKHNLPIPATMFWLECEDCDQMFQSQSSLKRHLLNSHKKDRRTRHYAVHEPAPDRYECEHCGHYIKRRCILKKHLEKVHNLIIERRKPPKKHVFPKGDFAEIPEMLMHLLPVGFEYKLKSFQHKEMDQFIAKFHFIVRSVEGGKDWLKDFLNRNDITMTKLTAFKSVRSNVLHKERLHCHRNTRAKYKGNKKHTNCPAQVSMSIRKLTSYDEKNVESTSFECIVILRHLHNHRLDDIEEAKYRKPLPEVVQKFERMFEEGIGPSRALALHQQNVQDECGDEYYKVSGDRSIIPDIRWVFYQHTKHRIGKNPGNAKPKKKKEVVPDNDCEVAATDPDDPSYKDDSEATCVEQKATKEVQQTVGRTHACLLCSRKYLNYRSLRIHALLTHRNQADEIAPQRRQAVRKCALCKKYKIDVTAHYQTTHGVEMIQEYLEFLTYKSFCEWKSTLEKTTQLKHVIGYDVEHFKEYSRLRYTCVQSRTAQQRRDHGFCPAEIDVRVYNNDHCSVSFLRTHVCALRPQSYETQPYVVPAAPDYSTNIWNCTILPDGTVESSTPIIIDSKEFYKINIDKDFYKINMDQVRIEVLGDAEVEVANISHIPTQNETIMCSLATEQQDADASILCHEDPNLGMVNAISDNKLEEIKNRLYRLANELPNSLGDPKDVEYIEYIIGAGEMYINGNKQNACFIDGM